MKKILALLLLSITIYSCSRVPLTGRRQVAFIPSSQIQSMANQQYASFMQQNKVITNTAEAQMVARVGQRIAAATTEYMRSKGLQDRLDGFKWEYKLVQSPEANAWCMPGGKIAVYTGILPLTQDEAGLAAVIGHEVAHAVAEHGNERMSQALIAQGVGTVGSVAISSKSPENVELFNQVYGVGSQLGMLSYSRKHELEADEIGMIFMAMAGYNPQAAIDLWKRMAAQGGARPPEILSTHPAESTRIAALQKNLKKAMAYYRP